MAWLLLTGAICLSLFYCLAQLAKARAGLQEDTFFLEEEFQTPVLSLAPEAPPYRGSVILVPSPGLAKEAYANRAEELARGGFLALVLDLPGHGSSPGRFSRGRLRAFAESSFDALLARNLVEQRKIAFVVFGPTAVVLEPWLREHQDVLSAAFVPESVGEGLREGDLPAGWAILPPRERSFFSPAADIPGLQPWLAKLFSSPAEAFPAAASSYRFWWWAVWAVAIVGFFPLVKTVQFFLSAPSDGIACRDLPPGKLLGAWTVFQLAGAAIGLALPVSPLQPFGHLIPQWSLSAAFLLPFLSVRWKPRLDVSALFLGTILFAYAYGVIGWTAGQQGIHLSLAFGRWGSMAAGTLLLLPFAVILELPLRRIDTKRGTFPSFLVHLLLFSVALLCGLMAGWFRDYGFPFSSLGFPYPEWLLGLLLLQVAMLAWLRRSLGNVGVCALLQAASLSWLFAAGSIRFL